MDFGWPILEIGSVYYSNDFTPDSVYVNLNDLTEKVTNTSNGLIMFKKHLNTIIFERFRVSFSSVSHVLVDAL